MNPSGKRGYPPAMILETLMRWRHSLVPLETEDGTEVPTCTNGVTTWLLSQPLTRRNWTPS